MTNKPRPSGLRRWHRWCGLGALLFLLLAALTGSPLVYRKELVHLLIAPEAALPSGYDVAAMAPQLDRIAATFAPTTRTRIKAPQPDEPYWTLVSASGDEQLLALDSLQPYTRNGWLLELLHVLRELHTELLLGKTGETVLLIGAIAGLFLCVTGLVLWWPTRRSFRWRWVLPKPLAARLLLMAHRHSGAVAAATLALILLTGAVMLWQKLVAPLLPPVAETALPPVVDPAHAPPSRWLLIAAQALPDGWPTYIRLAARDKPEVSIRFRLPGDWHANGRTAVTFDAGSGAGRVSARADIAPPARALLNQLYPLHSGYGMPTVYALLIFASGIAMLWLAVTGGLSYWKRR